MEARLVNSYGKLSRTPSASRAAIVEYTTNFSSSAVLAGILAGCNTVILNPSGDIALQQRNLIVVSTVLMLLIIVPVIVLTLILRLALPCGSTRTQPTIRNGTTRPSWKW